MTSFPLHQAGVTTAQAYRPVVFAQDLMTQRAKWSSSYEKGLVDILNEYREVNFSKAKIQDKEGQLKKDYKAIKTICSQSGVSWNQDASVINTTPAIWDDIIQKDPRLRKYENKSFPLFDSLDLLYEGQLAEGKHLFTSSKPPSTSKGPAARGRDRSVIDFNKENPWTQPINVYARPLPSEGEEIETPTRFDEPEADGWENECTQNPSNQPVHKQKVQGKKRSSFQLTESSSGQGNHGKPIHLSDNDEEEEEQDISSRSVTIGSSRGRLKRRNDTKLVPRIEETMSDFLNLKREEVAAKKQNTCQGQEFSITRCLLVLKEMADLSDDIKILASEVFKDATNREIFLGYETRLRGLWLTKEVNKIGAQSTTS